MEQEYQEGSLFNKAGMALSMPNVEDSEIPLGTLTMLMKTAGLDSSGEPPYRANCDDIAEAIDSDCCVVIRAYIEAGSDGFWVYTYSPEDVGAYGYGKTIGEAKNSILEGIETAKESYEEMEDQSMMPLSIKGDYRIEFDIQPALRDLPEDWVAQQYDDLDK